MQLIRRLPLSLRNTVDRRIWHYDQHGKFTVRSAYHVTRGLNAINGEGAVGSSSSSSSIGDKLGRNCGVFVFL